MRAARTGLVVLVTGTLCFAQGSTARAQSAFADREDGILHVAPPPPGGQPAEDADGSPVALDQSSIESDDPQAVVPGEPAPGTHIVHVIAAADEEWRALYGGSYKNAVTNAIERADDYMHNEFGVNLRLENVVTSASEVGGPRHAQPRRVVRGTGVGAGASEPHANRHRCPCDPRHRRLRRRLCRRHLPHGAHWHQDN